MATAPRAAACRRATRAATTRRTRACGRRATPRPSVSTGRSSDPLILESSTISGHTLTHAFRFSCGRAKGAHHFCASAQSWTPTRSLSGAPITGIAVGGLRTHARGARGGRKRVAPHDDALGHLVAAREDGVEEHRCGACPVVRQPVRWRRVAIVEALEQHVQQVHLLLGCVVLGVGVRHEVGRAREARRAPPPRRSPRSKRAATGQRCSPAAR